jgi:membrane-bound serine protease (ClpP class)
MVAGGLSFGSQASLDQRDLALVGQDGTIEADCRPAGMARIDGRRVDVVTRGEWLESGARVRVVEVQGNRVVVARREEKA